MPIGENVPPEVKGEPENISKPIELSVEPKPNPSKAAEQPTVDKVQELEAKKTDIERRRQEELNAQNSRIEEEKNKLEQKAKKKKTIIEWFTRDGKPSPPSPNGIYIEEIDNWHREQGHISRTREVENLTEGEVNKELMALS